MNAYTKISITGSESIDLSEFPELKNSITDTSLKLRAPTNDGFKSTRDSMPEEEQERKEENRFNVPKLMRTSSLSSSASALQSAVRRAFSMRRSSSVSERYCRIHDQPVSLASPIYDEEVTARSVKKNHSRGRILKACKKLFGWGRLH